MIKAVAGRSLRANSPGARAQDGAKAQVEKAARLRRVNGSEFRTAQQKAAVNTASFDSSD